jgi:predicted ATPase/DNA-binding CsgD family transcriptional regulator
MMDDDHPSPSQAFEPLSPREREILALLAEGLSNREIADRLVLALTTVKWYNQQLFNKLGVENRQQAVERARDLRVLEQPEPLGTSISHLPIQLTPFVGRAAELDDLSRFLDDPETRLVTILAPGGMGKTRCALAAAERTLHQFADGVHFVPLAPLTSPEPLVSTIAAALGLQLFADNRAPKQQLLDFLRAKQVLLVLDNFEHVVDGSVLVSEILQAAPRVKVLVTSRERLRLEGETIYMLSGLAYPEQLETENLLNYSAGQLFIQCAGRANSSFAAEDQKSIARICQLVQGMPLALELAAAWAGTLSTADIVDEIRRSADFLQTTMRNAPERLRSIRAVFEATWRRLTSNEQQTFRRLSVFRGGCTREAASVVANAEIATLAGLVDKALLWHFPESGRYEIHELLRQYAAEQLETADEAETTKNAHRDYFGNLARAWGKALKTPKQLQALDVLEADFDNLRLAFQHAIEMGTPEGIEPFTDLWYFYEIRERNVEGAQTFGSAIEALRGKDSITLGKLLVSQAIFHERFSQYNEERRLAQESVDILQRLNAEAELAFPLTALGVGVSGCGDLDGALVMFQRALEIAKRFDDQWVMSVLLVCLGDNAFDHQRFDEAKTLLLQAYALLTRIGNQWGVAFALDNLGHLAFRDGDYVEAKRLFETGLASARKLHHLTTVCRTLNGLRAVAIAEGTLIEARRYAEEGLKIERDLGHRYGVYMQIIGLAEVAIAVGSDDEARGWFHEALTMFVELNEPALILRFGLGASPYLAQTGAKVQALILMSFMLQRPWQERLSYFDQAKLETLVAQLQPLLPPDRYAQAWQEGQRLSLDDLLIRLYAWF